MESGPDRAARQRREWMLRRALAVSNDDDGGLDEADAAEVERRIELARRRKARRTVPVPIRVVRDPKLWR
jgi:hypothetical protein